MGQLKPVKSTILPDGIRVIGRRARSVRTLGHCILMPAELLTAGHLLIMDPLEPG